MLENYVIVCLKRSTCLTGNDVRRNESFFVFRLDVKDDVNVNSKLISCGVKNMQACSYVDE